MKKKHTIPSVKLALLSAAFLATFFISRDCSALSAGGVGGYPANPDPGVQYSDSWFIYNLNTGESKEDALLVINPSNEVQTIRLYAVDSIATGDGNFSLKKEDEPRVGVGAWVKLSVNFVTLNPGEERHVPFTITIPEGASVGEHSGGVIIQKAANTVDVGANSASILTRIGIRIYETVPGEIVRDIKIANFSIARDAIKPRKSFYRIDLTVENKSNVTLNPEATLIISGWGKTSYFPKSRLSQGLMIDLGDFTNFFKGEKHTQSWQLLRDQRVTTRWEWPEPAFGHYTFQAQISFEGASGLQTLITSPVSIWIIPWIEAGIFGAVVIILIILIVIWFTRPSERSWKPYMVQHGDQLVDLAQQAGISWKKLAKANKLKKPLVEAGRTIIVPLSFFGKSKDKRPDIKSLKSGSMKKVSEESVSPREVAGRPILKGPIPVISQEKIKIPSSFKKETRTTSTQQNISEGMPYIEVDKKPSRRKVSKKKSKIQKV